MPRTMPRTLKVRLARRFAAGGNAAELLIAHPRIAYSNHRVDVARGSKFPHSQDSVGSVEPPVSRRRKLR